MPALPWKDEYNINVAVIDKQHRRLSELAGRVHEVLESNPQGGQEIRQIVDELLSFTRLHFSTEEELMLKYEYPEYETHRAAHKQVLYRLGTLAELSEQPMRLATRIDPDASDDWVTNHLLDKDAQLGKFLNEKGVFKRPSPIRGRISWYLWNGHQRCKGLKRGRVKCMSDLLKIVYEVAAVRSDYLRLHQRLFHLSAGRLLQNLTRRRARGDLTNQQELEGLSQRLKQALEGLTQLEKEDLAIRRGDEIQAALCEYAQALTESMTALEHLMEMRQSPHDGRQSPCQSQATRIAYDDAVQYHNRLGARLNELLTTL